MNDMQKIPCVILRGGTSKGIYLKANHLPQDKEQRDNMILKIFGSPDVRQIDGLGGADPLTSKVAIIGPSTHPDANVDYTFGQVSINDHYIDYSGNCGNISSGVGPFAIDEGFVAATEPTTTVRIHNTNTGKILIAEVPTENGRAKVNGDCKIDGVPGTGAKIMMDFSGTAGSVTNKLLPTDKPVDTIQTSVGPLEISIVDVSNPCVFVRAKDVGMTGRETPQEINGDPKLLALMEEIRAQAAVMIGMAPDIATATAKSPAFPMVAFVAPAADYIDFTTGKTIKKEQVDFLSRMMFMQVLHKTYPGTGTACTGAAAKIPGTIVHEAILHIESINVIRIGHPAGVIEIEAAFENGNLSRAAFARTARRILEGYVFVRNE
ncbi:2-methylaconitate cis-trans isomerase PrpF family protein [Sporomusa sp. KB1]|uniref:2-methylaconitate cis-trans isomerase PrpF family protein n=1 Tax=Sporomusa sp. KB1 TaxID=943346 RepID=UPI00119FDC41|nr:PrpF domain-containing protein [Sporomusa sp. KB1]TWH48082.1 methylitaconate delta2-delta3-isomerase [Sporomusa sp. KB1]